MARKNRKQDQDAFNHPGGDERPAGGGSPQRNLDAYEHEREVSKHNTFDDQAFLEEYRSQLRERRSRTGGSMGRPVDRDRGLGALPPAGSVLHLSTGEIAVFDRDVPSKNYQLVYMLEDDGSAKPEGVFLLQAYEFEPIGRLPQNELEQLRESRLWYRDPLVFYLSEMKYASLVPVPPASHIAKPGVRPPAPPAHPAGERPHHAGDHAHHAGDHAHHHAGPSTHRPDKAAERTEEETRKGQPAEAPPRRTAPEPPPGPSGLRRGQKFRIQFDKSKVWEAVYWGEDEQGTVVAHQTAGNWSFMHLDLKRFENTLAPLEDILSEKEQYEVAESVKSGA